MVTNGLGQNNSSINGTYWQLYNGFNEYLNYAYGRNSSSRLDSLWFGSNANLNKQALDLALKMAG